MEEDLATLFPSLSFDAKEGETVILIFLGGKLKFHQSNKNHRCCLSPSNRALPVELLPSSLTSRFPPRNPPPVLTHRRAKQEAVSFAVASSLPLGVSDLARNKVLVAAAIAGTIGQLSKPLTSAISGKGIDLRMAVQSGGMPSAHSAAVTAAATLLGLERGFSASVFGTSVVFAALFMYDAQGARREVGIHAKILNKNQNSHAEPTAQNLEEDHYQSKRLRSSSMNCEENSPLVSISDKEDSYLIQRPAIASTEVKISDCTKVDNTEEPIHMEQYSHSELNESVGHTEIQVIVGALLGLVVGLATELTL